LKDYKFCKYWAAGSAGTVNRHMFHACADVAVTVDMDKSEQLLTSARRPKEQYYDVEENNYIQIIRTVICEVMDSNPGNKQV
jgi:hypothetical protein